MTCDLCTCTSMNCGHLRHLYACETALRTLISLKMSLEVRQVKFDDGFGLGV